MNGTLKKVKCDSSKTKNMIQMLLWLELQPGSGDIALPGTPDFVFSGCASWKSLCSRARTMWTVRSLSKAC